LSELDRERVHDYFSRRETVAEWWAPDRGPLAFHYDAELRVLDDRLGVAPDMQVLDVGTGRGRFGLHLAERGCRVLGIDLNPDMVELAAEAAQRRGVAERFEVQQGSAEDLAPLGPRRFDRVLCMELFDHLPDLSRALLEMAGVLAADGRLAFTYVPSESLYGSLGNVYRAFKRRRRPEELLISRTYSLAEVRRLLAGAGLALEGYWGVGVLCLNAQTRLFTDSPLLRLATSVARLEARWRPYHAGPLARHGAHVVGLARRV
jgi:SAM-dependent methyltransferase